MRPVKRLLAGLLFLLSCRAPHEDGPAPNVTFSANAYTKDKGFDTEKEYSFTLKGQSFTLERGGRFHCGRAGSLQVDLSEFPYVEELQYVTYGDEILVLLYELSDGESGFARVARVYLPTCELALTSDLPGFNLGPAALEGSTLYISTLGFVGRFNVETWGYDWTHGNLYESHKLNSFGKPVVYRDRVVFPESVTSSRETPRNVIVDKATGAMTITR